MKLLERVIDWLTGVRLHGELPRPLGDPADARVIAESDRLANRIEELRIRDLPDIEHVVMPRHDRMSFSDVPLDKVLDVGVYQGDPSVIRNEPVVAAYLERHPDETRERGRGRKPTPADPLVDAKGRR